LDKAKMPDKDLNQGSSLRFMAGSSWGLILPFNSISLDFTYK